MATSRKILREMVKATYLEKITKLLIDSGEEVLRVGSNEIAFPVTDSEGNEDFITLKVVIPTGSRDGDIYDGYSMAQDYEIHLAEKAEKAKKAKEAKEKKIALDQKRREQEKIIKEKKGKA